MPNLYDYEEIDDGTFAVTYDPTGEPKRTLCEVRSHDHGRDHDDPELSYGDAQRNAAIIASALNLTKDMSSVSMVELFEAHEDAYDTRHRNDWRPDDE